MNRTLNRIKTWWSIPFRGKLLLLEQLVILCYTSILVKWVPLRFYYHKYFRSLEQETDMPMQPYSNEIRHFYKLIRLVPWKVTCLTESLAFSIFFNRRGHRIPLFLGVKLGQEMEAHAWNFHTRARGFSAINGTA